MSVAVVWWLVVVGDNQINRLVCVYTHVWCWERSCKNPSIAEYLWHARRVPTYSRALGRLHKVEGHQFVKGLEARLLSAQLLVARRPHRELGGGGGAPCVLDGRCCWRGE